MTTMSLGLEARPRTRSDVTDWLTQSYRSGIDGLEAPLGSLDGSEEKMWLGGFELQLCRARTI